MTANFFSLPAFNRSHSKNNQPPTSETRENLLKEIIWGIEPSSGPIPKTIGHFSPIQRAQIEGRLGTLLAPLLSLATESDMALFDDGLYRLAVQLELNDHLESAYALFRALANPSYSASPALQRQAQQRFEAIAGTGSSGLRAEFLLRRLVRDSAEPAALFGMGAASTAFRLTRWGTMARLASSPGGFLSKGFGLQAASSLAGFAVEGLAFPLATRAANLTLGRNLEWNSASLARELASSYLSLGALRSAGLLSTYGMNAVLGGSGKGAFGSVSRALFPQAGMLAGIYLSRQAEIALGLRPNPSGTTALIDSLASLLQFNVAGELTRHVFGSDFHAWERTLDLQFEATRFPRPMNPLGLEPLLQMNTSNVGIHQHAGNETKGDNFSLMIGKKWNSGRFRAEIDVESFSQLLRQFSADEFKQNLQVEDLDVRFLGNFPPDFEVRAQSLLRFLNILALSPRLTIPHGRIVTIHATASHERVVFRKTKETEFAVNYFLNPERNAKTTSSEPPGSSVPPPSGPTIQSGRESEWNSAHSLTKASPAVFPRILQNPEQLSNALKQIAKLQDQSGLQYSFVLEGFDANATDLSNAARNIRFPEETQVRVLVTKSRRTFSAFELDHGLSWDEGASLGWSAAQGRALFNDLSLVSAEEAYQQIVAYSRNVHRRAQEESKFHLTEEIADPRELSWFLLEALNRHRMKGASLRVEMAGWTGGLLFTRTQTGGWQNVPSDPVRIGSTRTFEVSATKTGNTPSSPPKSDSNAPRNTSLKSSAIPILHGTGIQRLPSLIVQAYKDGNPEEGPRSVILEPSPFLPPGRQTEITVTSLNQASRGLNDFRLGTIFQLFDMKRRVTFVGKVSLERGIVWSQGNGNEWRIANLRAMRSEEVSLKTPLDLYLYLEALPSRRRGNQSIMDALNLNNREITIRWEGKAPSTFHYDLKTFVVYALGTHAPYGRSLTIEFADGGEPIRMENHKEKLWMEESAAGQVVASEAK